MTEPQKAKSTIGPGQASTASEPDIRTRPDAESTNTDPSNAIPEPPNPTPSSSHPGTPSPSHPAPDTDQPPPPHMALGSGPVTKVVGIVVTLALLLVFWLLWRGRELPFIEMRYQLTDSTGYQPLVRQRYLMGSVPRSLNGHRADPAHASLPDAPDGSIPVAAAKLTNPYPVDRGSGSLGVKLYAKNCAMCHGDAGHGDGPVGESYIPRPPDLTGPEIAALPEGQIYYSVTNGILSEPIAEAARYIPRDWHAFRQELSDRDRWALVDVVRSLAGRALAQSVEVNHASP